jgi:hypothetical protein
MFGQGICGGNSKVLNFITLPDAVLFPMITLFIN